MIFFCLNYCFREVVFRRESSGKTFENAISFVRKRNTNTQGAVLCPHSVSSEFSLETQRESETCLATFHKSLGGSWFSRVVAVTQPIENRGFG